MTTNTTSTTTSTRSISTTDSVAIIGRAVLASVGFVPVIVRAVGASIQALDEGKLEGRLQSADMLDLATGNAELHDFMVDFTKAKVKDYLGSDARKAHAQKLREEFGKTRPAQEVQEEVKAESQEEVVNTATQQ